MEKAKKKAAKEQLLLSEILASSTSEIFQKWIDQIKREFPALNQLDESVVIDDLPKILELLVDRLVGDRSESEPDELAESEGRKLAEEQAARSSREHGLGRIDFPDYTLGAVIREYRLLRSVILEVLAKYADLDDQTIHVIYDHLDKASELAAESYFRRTQEILKERSDRLGKQRKKLENITSAITHDVKAPISAAKSATAVLKKDMELNSEQRQIVDLTHAAIERSSRMISDLNDSQRLEKNEPMSIHPQNCDLRKIAQELIDEFKLRVGERFEFQSPEQVEGQWDELALKRILANLFSNAIKYGKAGRPVSISVEATPKQVILRVLSEGTPIEEKKAQKIFNLFERGTEEEHQHVPGSGVGLAVVKELAEAHGGEVRLETTLSSNIFTVLLPRAQSVRSAG